MVQEYVQNMEFFQNMERFVTAPSAFNILLHTGSKPVLRMQVKKIKKISFIEKSKDFSTMTYVKIYCINKIKH